MAEPVVNQNPLDPPAPIATTGSVVTPTVVVQPAAQPSISTPPAAPAQPSVSTAPGPRTVTLSADDDAIPDDAELLSLSRKALSSRLDRHTKRELRDRFGTDNPDDIKAKLDKLAVFEQQEEERRVASLTELDHERELRTAAEKRAEDAEAMAKAVQDAQEIGQADNRIQGILDRHIDPDLKDVVVERFRQHLQSMSDAEIDAMTDEQINQWAVDQVMAKPKWGKAMPAAVATTAPLTNGARTEGVPAPAAGSRQTATNYSPSAQNAMTPQEARRAAAAEGYRY